MADIEIMGLRQQSDIDPIAAVLARGVEQLGALPLLDRTVVRVRALTEDPDAMTRDVVEALETDANLAANVLRHANSAHCSAPVRASTLHQAVTLIGRRGVSKLVVEAVVCSFFERAPGAGVARGQLHIHAAQVAACAAEIGRRTNVDGGAAHLAGLLHDLGKLVLPAAFPADQLQAVADLEGTGMPRAEAERAVLGVDHADAGAFFARTAGLEDELVRAIAEHHGTGDGDSGLSACVQAANAAVALVHGHACDDALLEGALGRLGLELSDLEDIVVRALPSEGLGAKGTTGLADQVARLEREARTDDLTDLLNRRYWSLAAREQLAERGGSVIICDVDWFKRINDNHGHQTGDYVLSEIGRILRANGIAGRLGGDEFALLTSAPDPEGHTARRVIEAVAQSFPSPRLPVSISLGVATATGPGADISELLRRADEALYVAKGEGRSTFRLTPIAA